MSLINSLDSLKRLSSYCSNETTAQDKLFRCSNVYYLQN